MEYTYAQDGNPQSSMRSQQHQVAQETSLGYDGVFQDRLNVSHVEAIQADRYIYTLASGDDDSVGPGYATKVHMSGPSFSSQPMPSDGNDLDFPLLASDFDLGPTPNTQSMSSGASYPLASPFSADKNPLYAAEPNPNGTPYLQKPYELQFHQPGPHYAPLRPMSYVPGLNNSEVLRTSGDSAVYLQTQAPSAHMVGKQSGNRLVSASASASLNTFSAPYPETAPPNKMCPNAGAVVAMPTQGALQGLPTHDPILSLRSAPKLVNETTSYRSPEELARKLGIPNGAWKDVNHCYDARFAMKLLASDEYISATPQKKKILRKAWVEERTAQLENLGRKELNDLLERWDART